MTVRLSEIVENPTEGWTTNNIGRRVAFDEDPEWEIELIRIADGEVVSMRNKNFHVAWVRVCERADMISKGLMADSR